MGIYLTEDAELVLTVASQEQREQELQTEGEHCLQDVGCNSFSVSADVALVSDAHDNGFSLGKYYAYLQLARYDETVTPDSCRDMSISTIHELIDEHQHGRGHHSEPEDTTEGSEKGSEKGLEEELPGHHGHEDYH